MRRREVEEDSRRDFTDNEVHAESNVLDILLGVARVRSLDSRDVTRFLASTRACSSPLRITSPIAMPSSSLRTPASGAFRRLIKPAECTAEDARRMMAGL